MRGKRGEMIELRFAQRITPARAGKTNVISLSLCRVQDHPRACGENPDALIFHGIPAGSPPRVRGKPMRIRLERIRKRITPARAGKTFPVPPSALPGEDHPRACGENFLISALICPFEGSPPRVRGKLSKTTCETPLHRITPARAGKTDFVYRSTPRGKDHPRACGENAFT